MKLVAFDLAAYQAEPTRLRTLAGAIASASAKVDQWVVALWAAHDYPVIYAPRDFKDLRLAAKTETVRVRLYRDASGICAALAPASNVDYDGPFLHAHWISDIIEVEVEAA